MVHILVKMAGLILSGISSVVFYITKPFDSINFYNKTFIKRIKPGGWVLFGLFILGLGVFFFDGYLENREKIYSERPIINLGQGPQYILEETENNDTRRIMTTVQNYGGSNAIEVCTSITSFSQGLGENTLYFDSTITYEGNEYDFIGKGAAMKYILNYKMRPAEDTLPTYIYFRVAFKNEDKSICDTLRKIFEVSRRDPNELILQVKPGLNQILTFALKMRHVW